MAVGNARDYPMTPWLVNQERMDREFGMPERDRAEYEQNLRIIAGTPAPQSPQAAHVDDDDLHPIESHFDREREERGAR